MANGAAVILSVCDDEVERCGTVELTAAAVPALLLPPPATEVDEHLIQGLPPLEPYARLFHRYQNWGESGGKFGGKWGTIRGAFNDIWEDMFRKLEGNWRGI